MQAQQIPPVMGITGAVRTPLARHCGSSGHGAGTLSCTTAPRIGELIPVLTPGRLLTGAVIPRTLVTSESYPEGRIGSQYPMEPSWLRRTSPVRIAGKEYP